MHLNPALAQLGFSPSDRVVIIHADDLGMCHAANAAYADLVENGLVKCGSVMVPCPCFPELAAYGREHPETDIGVHLTLTSEYQHYRWAPITTQDPVSGLVDQDGYQPRTVKALHASMSAKAAVAAAVAAAVIELRAQIDRALASGLDVTHIDTHMGAVMHPALFSHYVALALEYRVPGLFPRLTPALIRSVNLDPQVSALARDRLSQLEAAGFPLVDHVASVSLQGREDLLGQYKRAFDALQPGLTHFIIHPAAPGAEIEVITESAWTRIADYQMTLSQELQEHLQATGIHLIGYRTLRQVMRASLGKVDRLDL